MTKRSHYTPSKKERRAGFSRPVGNGGLCDLYFAAFFGSGQAEYWDDNIDQRITLWELWGRLLKSSREGA